MKKLWLGFSSLAILASPILTVVSCGEPKDGDEPKVDFDFTSDLNKIQNQLVSSKSVNDLKDAVGQKEINDLVTASDLGITLPDFSEGITTSMKVKTVYNLQTAEIEINVILTKEDNTANKDIKIKAHETDFTKELDKLDNYVSSKIRDDFQDSIGLKKVDEVVTAKQLGIVLPNFSEGITSSMKVQTPYNHETGIIIVTITLTDKIYHATKDLQISSLATDFTDDLNKLTNLTSSKIKLNFRDDIVNMQVGEDITTEQLGITLPNFSDGITTSMKVKTVYDPATTEIVVTVFLFKNGEQAEKDITIVGSKRNFAKYLDTLPLSYNSDKIRAKLKADLGWKSTHDEVTAEELGITLPTFEDGIYVAKIEIGLLYMSGFLGVVFYLSDGVETVAADELFIYGKQNEFTDDLALLEDLISDENKDFLKASVGNKVQGDSIVAADLGITLPLFKKGTKASMKVQTPYNLETGIIIVTVTLSDGEDKTTKDITITANQDVAK